MWADGQHVDRHEVEPLLSAAYPNLPHFIARVTEIEEVGRTRLRIELLSPNNQPLTVAENRPAVYWSIKASAPFPQVDEFAA